MPRGNADSTDPSQRVVVVARATRCCTLAVESALAHLVAVAAEVAVMSNVQQLVHVRELVGGKAFIGGTASGVIQAFPEGAVLPPGSTVILPAGGPIAEILSQGVAVQVASILNATADGIRKIASGDCEACLMRQALPQSPNKRRKRTLWTRK